MAKQSWLTRQKTKSTKAINKVKRGIFESLASLIVFILFFYLIIPYRAIFKKDVSPFWKPIYKILTSLFFILIVFTGLTSESIKNDNQGTEYYITLLILFILALTPWFYLLKKKD